MKNEKEFSHEKAEKELKKNFPVAEKILKEGKLDELLERLEKKLKVFPKIGDKLSHIPIFVSLIKSYVKKEYTKVPLGTIIAIVSAMIYFVSAVDLIPDFIPIVGYFDDVGVGVVCFNLVESDIKEYIEWRDSNK